MKAQWIWYKNEFIYYLYNKVMNRRREKNVKVLCCWKLPSVCPSVKFHKKFTLENDGEIYIKAKGELSVRVDDEPCYRYDLADKIFLSAGEHSLLAEVYNPAELPCLYVEGENCESGGEWTANVGNGKWIHCDTGGFFDKELAPTEYALPVREVLPLSEKEIEALDGNRGILYDFGREMFAYPVAEGIEGEGRLFVNYGESRLEALDPEHSEQSDEFFVRGEKTLKGKLTKAFRYVFIPFENTLRFDRFYALDEYYPLESRATFKSSNEQLNEIYRVAEYTLALTSREFFIDGIKRDRWVWAGDALQSELMSFYSFFDKETIKRTIVALLGKDNFEQHVNGIMDYSFYVILAIREYYRYAGDKEFLSEVYPRAAELLNFCLGRRNERGFMQKINGEWVFIDWADFPVDGEVCAEQILLYASMEALADVEETLKIPSGGKLKEEAARLKEKIETYFWTEQGYAHDSEKNLMTRYGNIFAVLTGLAGEEKRERILNSLLDEKVQKIKTPYMKFYETSALAELGRADKMLDLIKSYWGGMLTEGATSFWEEYDPAVTGGEKYSMYGRKYGKSLCHSWGASPVYLIGKYLVGLKPAEDGYKKFRLCPYLDGKTFFEAAMPLNEGRLEVSYKEGELRVFSSCADGELVAEGKIYSVPFGKEFILKLKGGTNEK